VTSIERLTGDRPSVEEVAQAWTPGFLEIFGRSR
jgi:hypothetical protein